MCDDPNTVSDCVPTSNHPHVSENLSKKKSNCDDLDLLVTFKSNLSFQNVKLITEYQYFYP